MSATEVLLCNAPTKRRLQRVTFGYHGLPPVIVPARRTSLN